MPLPYLSRAGFDCCDRYIAMCQIFAEMLGGTLVLFTIAFIIGLVLILWPFLRD